MVSDSTPVAVRVPSGIPGLDTLIGGGYPHQRTVLVCGDIGTGKTTCAVQFLVTGAQRGEAGVLISVDEKPQHVLADARSFGWDLDGADEAHRVTVLDASAYFTALRSGRGLDARQVAADLAQRIRHAKARQLVIDSVTSLIPDGAPLGDLEDFLRSLIFSVEDNLGCTTMLTANVPTRSVESDVARAAKRLASGVIELTVAPVEGRMCRSLLARKMRGAPAVLAARPFEIVASRGLVLE